MVITTNTGHCLVLGAPRTVKLTSTNILVNILTQLCATLINVSVTRIKDFLVIHETDNIIDCQSLIKHLTPSSVMTRLLRYDQ